MFVWNQEGSTSQDLCRTVHAAVCRRIWLSLSRVWSARCSINGCTRYTLQHSRFGTWLKPSVKATEWPCPNLVQQVSDGLYINLQYISGTVTLIAISGLQGPQLGAQIHMNHGDQAKMGVRVCTFFLNFHEWQTLVVGLFSLAIQAWEGRGQFL